MTFVSTPEFLNLYFWLLSMPHPSSIPSALLSVQIYVQMPPPQRALPVYNTAFPPSNHFLTLLGYNFLKLTSVKIALLNHLFLCILSPITMWFTSIGGLCCSPLPWERKGFLYTKWSKDNSREELRFFSHTLQLRVASPAVFMDFVLHDSEECGAGGGMKFRQESVEMALMQNTIEYIRNKEYEANGKWWEVWLVNMPHLSRSYSMYDPHNTFQGVREPA